MKYPLAWDELYVCCRQRDDPDVVIATGVFVLWIGFH